VAVKTLILTVAFLAIGVVVGLGFTWAEFHGVENWHTSDGLPVDGADESADAALAKAPKVVVVNGEKHDFGAQERYTKRSHVFIVKNYGQAPLKLARGETTCSCTLSDAGDTTLQPGEQIEIKLEWETKLDGQVFSQSAEGHTNDPRRKLVRLSIFGRVVDTLSLHPDRLTFADKPANEPSQARVKLLSMRSGELTLGPFEFTNFAASSYFEVVPQAMTAEELEQQRDAEGGYWLQVTAKSGLPLGAINQTIRIPTFVNGEPGETVQLVIEGNVVGDIRLLHAGEARFIADQNRLVMKTVHRDEGAIVPMRVLVTGPHRDSINLRIGTIDPENILKAKLGNVKKLSEGKTHMYELTVEIPKGSPLINRTGAQGAPRGVITIESDHPDSPKFKLFVEFAIEG
jgi:hypothetical protein